MKRFPFYPFLVGLFSLLSVYLSNTQEATAGELVLPAIIVLAMAAILLGISTLAMRNVHRAAILTAALVFLFFTYGYWVQTLWNIHPDGSLRNAYRWVVLVGQVVLLVLIGYAAVRWVKEPRNWTRGLNWFSCFLLASPLLMSASRLAHGGSGNKEIAANSQNRPLLANLQKPSDRPDIYFIVLDAHGRNDVLREQYDYDDSPFLNHLKQKGFFVADQSTSNYMWTMLSIGSTLNMRYLDDLSGNNSAKWRQITDLLRDSMLVAELKSIGYRTVAFESMEPWLCFDNADRYYKISNQVGISPLQQVILDTSVLSQLGGERLKTHLIVDQFHLKREMMLYKLAKMPQVVPQAGPKFVFMHIYEPHTPFVFAADGSDPVERGYGSLDDGLNKDVTNEQYHAWYAEQAKYTDRVVAGMIDTILARSKQPPVIVLIGDHGPRSGIKPEPDAADLHECFGNLTAVYLPGKKDKELYPQITPVNLFRVVLNDCFAANLPLLPDKCFYSYPDAYAWHEVTGVVRPATDATAAASGRR